MFSFLRRFDWSLNFSLLILAVASLLTIYSIDGDNFYPQLLWFILAALIIFFFLQLDWRPLVNYRWVIFGIYLAALGLLLLTYFFAPVIRGSRSWLVLGPLQFQTSEIAKLSLIILYSYYFAQRHVLIVRWQNILVPLLYLLPLALLVLLQPDLGSVLILFGIYVGFLLVSGIRWRHLALGLVVIGLLGFWAWNNLLFDYQQERIFALFHPRYDPLGVNYNVIQSKIAIGSAGLWGKGWGQGTQSQLGFLPEAGTDFIFPAFTEEWGLLGAVFLLLIFGVMIWRILLIGLRLENNFGRLVCLGTVIVFLLHLFINLGSALGLTPVIGVSLPFFSYGGSNLLTSAALIGIIQSIVFRSSF